MEPKYRFRLYLLTALVLAGCGTLLSRLHEFQIEKRNQFVANIPTTHTVSVREPGVRGEITDRNGVILARNRRSYEVVFNLQDIYQSWHQQNKKSPQPKLEETVKGPGGMPVKRTKKDIVRIVNEWIIPRIESYGLGGKRFSGALETHYETHGGLVPFTYRTDLTYDEFAQLAERSLDLPGVSVSVRPRRVYPYGTLACHVLGRVNQWEKGTIPEEFQKRNMHYLGDDFGKTGVEATMDEQLRGEGGMRVYIRNEKNKVIGLGDYTPPGEGARVELTIDSGIQYIVENALRQIGRGAAVVMNTNTGEVLAMASVPNFDPNDFVPSIADEQWMAYIENKANPFVNRAISPYIPGSTYKLPTAITAARYNHMGHEHNCIGYIPFGKKKRKIRCWKRAGHGTLDLSQAIQRSCNPYFMSLSGELRSRAMVDTFQLLGLGKRTGIRLPNENPGIVPGSKFWKREIKPGAIMTSAALAQMSIGQFDSLATPLQICSVTSTIANGGRYYQPRIVRRVINTSPNGRENVLIENIPVVKADLLKEGVTRSQLEVIRRGMWRSANEVGGTGRLVALKEIFVAVKTGTAQTGSSDPANKNNAWVTSFAPYDNPRYAVCVMVKNGGSGGAVAGPLAHTIYRNIFKMETGRRPLLTKMGIYEGNFKFYKEIKRPDDDLLDIPFETLGETGDEIDPELLETGVPIKVKPKKIPLPSFTPVPDTEKRPPRATIVEDDE